MGLINNNDGRRKITLEEFCEMNAKFGGVMRLLYCDPREQFVICNISNQSYALFLLYINKTFEEEGYLGLLISGAFARELYQNPSKIRSLTRLNKKQIRKLTFFRLDDHRLEVLKKYQEEADQKGPSKEIDFEMEKRMVSVAQKNYQARKSQVRKVKKKKRSLKRQWKKPKKLTKQGQISLQE
jgi:hypothetical protein